MKFEGESEGESDGAFEYARRDREPAKLSETLSGRGGYAVDCFSERCVFFDPGRGDMAALKLVGALGDWIAVSTRLSESLSHTPSGDPLQLWYQP